MTWSLGRVRQCRKCPWKVTTDPHDIPNGYDIDKHKSLQSTIAAEEGDPSTLANPELRIMACHESGTAHCIGWLSNQIAENNLQLRLSLLNCDNVERIKLVGKQHRTFADTLPRKINNKKSDNK